MNDSEHSLAKYSDTDTFSSSDSDVDEVDMADLHMEIDLLDKEKSTHESEDVRFRRGLSRIFLKYNVKHNAISAILKFLQVFVPHLRIPSDARSLVKTPRSVAYREIGGGTYHHFGLERSIKTVCQSRGILTNDFGNVLNIQINIDGLPVFKSSNSSLWPILGRVVGKNHLCTRPFMIGVFYGESKPTDVNEFLKDFCDEYAVLKEKGIQIENTDYVVRVSCFICDAPARAFVKKTKSHSGYGGCDKCITKGEWYAESVRFTEHEALLRNDTDFVLQKDKEHHRGRSILCDVGIGMVSEFPLDYMHLVALGVMRRLMHAWVRGKHYSVRLGPRDREEINSGLLELRKFCPSEFNRKPRGLKELDRWKATEFRTFLLYTGMVVTKKPFVDANKIEVYNNFVELICAIRILSNPKMCTERNALAEKILRNFFLSCMKIYGKEFMSYNVHALLHLHSDAKRYGPLDDFSAFPFENYLQEVKRMVRKCSDTLQQVVKRVEERNILGEVMPLQNDSTTLLQATKGKPVPKGFEEALQYKGVVRNGIRFTTEIRDNCVIVENCVALILNVITVKEDILIVYRRFREASSFFSQPLDSAVLGIVKVTDLGKEIEACKLKCVTDKCFMMKLNNERIAACYVCR